MTHTTGKGPAVEEFMLTTHRRDSRTGHGAIGPAVRTTSSTTRAPVIERPAFPLFSWWAPGGSNPEPAD